MSSSMRFGRSRRRCRSGIGFVVFVAATVLTLVVRSGVAGSDEGQTVSALIYRGGFSEAREVLSARPVERVEPSLERIAPVLADYLDLQAVREERRKDLYEEAFERVEKDMKENKPVKALTSALKAMNYAEDQEQFGQHDQIKQIVSGALQEAEKCLKEHEWLKAGSIYADLSSIYEKDKTYEQKMRECAKRARIDAIYKPDGDWRIQIADIGIDVMPEVSAHVDRLYVESPDMQKLALGGLEALMLLSESKKLREVFPSLADEGKQEQFVQRMRRLTDQVKSREKEEFKFLDLWKAFISLSVINQDTFELPDALVIREFIDGALDQLDQFTGMVWPFEIDDFEKHTMGRFSGVGIQITMENNKLKVVTPIFGTPAYRAGIAPEDLIVSINGETTEGITSDQAVRKITGPKGTKVVLGILHSWEDEPVEIPILRDTIIIHTVKGVRRNTEHEWTYMMDPKEKIAYIRITSFTESTAADLRKAMSTIEANGARGLILDLRFNPGGTLISAVQVADMFLEQGRIVSTRGRRANPPAHKATSSGTYKDLPMIVLISRFSASGSEIVCGALQDHGRAMVIGGRSFGKGSVQNVIPIADDTCRLKLTTAYYYLPDGRCLHRKPDSETWGVEPDIKIKLTPADLPDVIELQRESEIIYQPGNGLTTQPAATAPTTRPTTATKPGKTYPQFDIQLETALLVMRTRLAGGYPWRIAADQPKKATIHVAPTTQPVRSVSRPAA